MVNVDFGAAFGRHVAQVDLLVHDLDLRTHTRGRVNGPCAGLCGEVVMQRRTN